MLEVERRKRNAARLAELFPTFRSRIAAVIAALEAQGVRPRIQDAWRSPKDQLAAFESGHSKLRFGFHNVTGAGGQKESLAVDMLDDDHPLNPSPGYLLRLAAAAEQEGLITGIRWGLPARLAEAIDEAIAANDMSRAVKVGWDPTHTQVTGMTPAGAKAGKRP